MNRTYRIDLVEHAVPIADLPAAFDGLRVAHFGDLHAPKPEGFLRQLNRMLRDAQPDLLVCSGDLVDIPHWCSVGRRQLPLVLEAVQPRLGTFMCMGNHDRLGLLPALRDMGIRVLLNRWAEVQVDGQALHIGGVYARRLWQYPKVFERFAATVPAAGPTILLSHLPSAIWTFSKTRLNLVLSGHTHAGQWRFWRLGCLWTHDDIPRAMAGGLHKVGSTHLFVTAGLGESGPIPVRFRCPPEIAVLTLRRCAHGC